MIDDTIKDYDLFVKGSNLSTFPIVYNYHSDRNELKTLLLSKFNNIDRIAFVFHNSNMYNKQFLNNQEFFCISDSVTNTENVDFIIDIINDLKISHVDFLACNSLEYDIWKKYYNILQTQTKTNVIIGASDDATGNIKYGGDWIMETTNEDIKNIYFNELIDNYTNTLATTITINGGSTTNNNIYIKQLSDNSVWYSTTNNSDNNTSTGSWTRIDANVDWQIVLNNTNTIKTEANRLKLTLLTDIIIKNINNCLIINTDYITIDGNNKTITIDGISNYPGLIQNGTGNSSTEVKSSNGKNNIIIQNINIISSNSTLAPYSGWICQAFYGNTSSGTNTISNCTNNNGFITYRSGGIGGGSLFAFSTGTNTITNCKNMATFSGDQGGGIVGRRFAYSSSVSSINTITNCTNSGEISYTNVGGIAGIRCFNSSSGTNLITNCTNNGIISGSYSGGIVGPQFAQDSPLGTHTITNCTNTGEISSNYVGGIAGIFFGLSSSGTNLISNCTNTGEILANGTGGIVAQQSAQSSSGTNTITNCINSGKISGICSGGICGSIYALSSSGTNTITNCTNSGEISGNYAGGITGSQFAQSSSLSSTNTITNCANTGNISGSYSGGITGSLIAYTDDSTKNPSVTISNCYSVGTISNTTVNSGGICAGYDTTDSTYTTISSVTISNCYTLYGLIKAPVQSDKVTFNISNIYEANGKWSTVTAITAITNGNLVYKKNNLYVWAYSKSVSNIDQLNSPFILYSINPSNNPVTNFIATDLKAAGITSTYLRSFNFTEYELLFVGFSIVDLIPEIDNGLKKLQDDLSSEVDRAKEIENELIKNVNKLNLLNPMWVQKMNKSK